MSRIINIALVGHVANGKTTLVNSLSKINTKKYSYEIKTGRTIKLGYANCVFWQCKKCLDFYSNSQNESIPMCCNLDMDKKSIVSFVDAPGHHSYVHTMIKGATIVDAAILVTDVRKEPMQPQTMEHLAILSVLDIKNIIVVQNKSDLVSPDDCIKHYELLKKELIGTAAENAPIIPISAQNNININLLRKLIIELTNNVLKHPTYKKNVFQIIRSFDINKPSTDIKDLKGGVIGGTGNSVYKVGDIVEIRPGLITNNMNYIPIKTQIQSIFSESEPKLETTIGGLYGIGTKLDPSLTIADKLTGNLLGISDDLPEVKTEIDMKVITININKKEKIKINNSYKLIIGNVVVSAIAKNSTNIKNITFVLSRPICTIENKCLIYNTDSNLIAFGVFGKSEKNIFISIQQPDYKELIKDFKIHEKIKSKIPCVKIIHENRNIIWSNIDCFANSINRQQNDIIKYLSSETLLSMSLCASGLRIYKTKINCIKIESIMKKYIKQYVLCKQCNSLNTDNTACLSCGAGI